MGKRGNGEGSITRRKDGLYMARYTVQTATGAKRKTLYGKTRQEVSEKLTKAMADRDGGLVYDAGSMSVGEYLNGWLKDSLRGTVRASTVNATRSTSGCISSRRSESSSSRRSRPQTSEAFTARSWMPG